MSGSVKENFIAKNSSMKPLMPLAWALAMIGAGVVVSLTDNVSLIRGISMVVIILFAGSMFAAFSKQIGQERERLEKEWDDLTHRRSTPPVASPTRRYQA